MFRLFEDSGFVPVVLGDFKLVAICAIKLKVAGLCDVGKGQDIRNPIWTKPNFSVSGNSASQFRHCLSSLSVNGQATFHFVNVDQQVRIRECVGSGLAVQ